MLDILLFRAAGAFEIQKLRDALEEARTKGNDQATAIAEETYQQAKRTAEANLELLRESQRKRHSITSKQKKRAAAQAALEVATPTDRDAKQKALVEAQTELEAATAAQNEAVQAIEEVRLKDEQWRETLVKTEHARRDMGKHNKAVGQCKKAKDEAGAAEAMRLAGEMKVEVARLEKLEAQLKDERDGMLRTMGNVCHESVPDNDDEDDPALVDATGPDYNVRATSGDTAATKRWSHVDLFQMLDLVDLERGQKVAGERGYFLKGYGVLLNQAIINLALAHLADEGYTPLQTPFFMRPEAMKACAQLSDYHEALYKVIEKEDAPDRNKYLIATSEQPIACFHMGEALEEKTFPMRYAGYSTCFRKEAGKAGRDTGGIFRTHQFEKVEQFVYCSPDGDESWEEMERMLGRSTAFYEKLGIPYRVINIVSGELNDAAAKKYDVEGWFPGSKAFRELVSCSNCTDYQARRLNVRYGTGKGAPYCHMLNSTLTAVERTMCCCLENWQTAEGIVLPEALRPLLGGRALLPFKYDVDKDGKRIPRQALAID